MTDQHEPPPAPDVPPDAPAASTERATPDVPPDDPPAVSADQAAPEVPPDDPPAVSADQATPDVPPVAPPAVTAPPPDYSAAGVPSLDFVRDKIEGRHANALGATELAEAVQPEVKAMHEQAAEREKAAADKLDAIRRSLRGEPAP